LNEKAGEKQDKSELDKRYFVDNTTYNCPFCHRNNLIYFVEADFEFDWSNEKKCHVYFVRCSSCEKVSMHLSCDSMLDPKRCYRDDRGELLYRFKNEIIDIDSKMFYSAPKSFFVIDKRIPKILRESISEAEGCIKMNYLTGASACTRKAIYELLVKEKAEGADYESKIKYLKKEYLSKYPNADTTSFDILSKIKGMTSDKIHEQSWDKWDSKHLTLFITVLRSLLYDLYVLPKIREETHREILLLAQDVSKDKRPGPAESSK
jgi:transcription elongation factor Elf1